MDDPYIVLDLETTGLSAYKDRITEIAAVKIHKGKTIESFHTLINPGYAIPKHITRLTGINDKMVKDSPAIEDVLSSLKEFLGEDIIVAHNAGFDFNFLAYNFLMHQDFKLENKTICTYKLANRLLDIPRKRLVDVCEHFEVVNDQAHRAMSDVQATMQILSNMLDLLVESNISSTENVILFQNVPRARALRMLESDK